MDKKEREKEVIRLYVEECEQCSNIAKLVNIQRRNVYRILERNKISLRETNHTNCKICKKDITQKNNRNRSRCGTCNTNIRRYRVKKIAVEYLGGKCKCGWSGDISGYDFHHREPEEKEFHLTGMNMANRKWSEVKKELDKCELICALCHRLEHSNYKDENFLAEAEDYDFSLFIL